MPRIVRRLGPTPQERGCHSNSTCPDVFELDDGDFAVIGTPVDHNAVDLPLDAGVADHEVMVIVPRSVLVDARDDIPEA